MKTKNSFTFLIFLLIVTSLAACQSSDQRGSSSADTAPVGNDSTKMLNDGITADEDIVHESKVESDGATFMDSAAVGGMMEVDVAKIALEKSSNAKVKNFATLMIADHTKANTELKAIATKLEHILPSTYPAHIKAHMDEMKKLDGKQFDSHYMDMMVKDHGKTVALFKSASSMTPEIKDFAARTLPVLEKHNQMAKEIDASLK